MWQKTIKYMPFAINGNLGLPLEPSLRHVVKVLLCDVTTRASLQRYTRRFLFGPHQEE